MPHVDGHVKNSILRVGMQFPKDVGVLLPFATRELKTKDWSGNPISIPPGVVDFPIMFANDDQIDLQHGQHVKFLLHHITTVRGKHLVFAQKLVDAAAHKNAALILKSGAPPVGSAAAALNAEETKYRKSTDYSLIFKSNKVEDNDTTIEWLLNHALSFDDMNLATN